MTYFVTTSATFNRYYKIRDNWIRESATFFFQVTESNVRKKYRKPKFFPHLTQPPISTKQYV